MASIVSPEMNTMIDLSHELTAALSSTPMRVTRALVRKKFVQSDVLLEMLIDDTPTGKTVILVDAVKKTIEASPAKFSELIEILSELSWATNVVENLRSIYQRYQASGPVVPYHILSDDSQSAQLIPQQTLSVATSTQVLRVPTEQVLLERDIATLLNLLHNFSDKWNEIGLGLGFTPSELKQISSNPSLFMSAPTSFLRELLSQWIQWPAANHPRKPTLGALCETLCSSLVGLGSLAEEVQREMERSTADQLHQVGDNVSNGSLDIANKIETLENVFDGLRTRIIIELSALPDITVQKLLDKLTCLPLSLKKEYQSSIEERISKMREEIKISELFTVHLNPLLSFIDYSLIEFFIKKFGSDKLKKDMRSYCGEMKLFMKETTIKQLINYFPGQPEVPPKFSLVQAKIGMDASKCTLEQINIIRKKYCSEVKLSEIVFHLVAIIDSNSFIIWWIVPQILVSDIMECKKVIRNRFFQKYRFTYITLDDMWLYTSEAELEVMWIHVSNANLVDQFQTMHKQLAYELNMQKTPIDKLSQWLIDQQPNLQKDTSMFLSKAIMTYPFLPFASFVDFTLLQTVIEQFGSDCLRDVMMSYCKYMSVFTKQSTAQQLLGLLPVHTKLHEDFIKVECEIVNEPSGYICDNILSVKDSICSEIDFSQFVFTMSHIRKPLSNSFTVSWLVPAHLASDLIESASQLSSVFYIRNNIASLSIGSRWVYNPKLLFSSKLKEQYLQFQGSPSPVNWIPSPTKKIFRLAMIQRERVQHGHVEDGFVQMTISGRVDDILHAKSPVELEHIFRNALRGGEIILIEGAPGSGKSTLTVHICQTWSKGELFQEFTLVILVQLRDPAVQRAQTIADLLPVENIAVAQKLAAELVATNGRGVLWVLDGWDKLPPHLQQDSIFCILTERTLIESSVLVTSRPISSGDLQLVVSSRIEVLGFTPEEQRQYFTECLQGDTKALQEKIQENPVVQSICYLPLNAAFIVHTFKYRGQSLPNTEYEIYLSVILSCIQRHFEREGRVHDSPRELASLDDLSRIESVREPFQSLCELAYHGVVETKLTFSSSDLPQGSNTLSLLQAVESFLQSGKSVFYNFLHMSIQEILSAYYIATWLPECEQVSQFQQLFNQPRFTAVFQFYAAITKLKSPGIQEVVGRIVEARSKPLLVSLLRCLYEVQDPSLCLYVAERLEYKLDLSETSLSPLDCLSISFFLSTVSSKAISVDLIGCYIGNLGTKYLAKYLSSDVDRVSKVTINLSANEIPKEGGSHIARMLYSIEHLYLTHNPIGDTGASLIFDAMQGAATLKTVIMRKCGITSSGAKDLSRALCQNRSLEKLDICSNNLGDEGITHVAEALKQNRQLKELWISRCGMTDKGAASLASALRVNNTLKMIYVGVDKGTLTNDVLSTIAQSVSKSSEFVKLVISCTSYSTFLDHLRKEMNLFRERNGLPPIEIKATGVVSTAVPPKY